MFQITTESINQIRPKEVYDNPRVGGIVTFEGTVRNHNDGHAVTSLKYQAYDKMAVAEGNRIVKEALEKYSAVDVYCIHRTGHLAIGDTAVYVAATGEHRKEAFEACEFVIDMIKARVPIWKREHYVDQEPNWVACHQCKEASHKRMHAEGHKHTHACNHSHEPELV